MSKSEDEDILKTAGNKQVQLIVPLDFFIRKVNYYREVISTGAPSDHSEILLRVKKLATKIHSLKVKYEAAKIAAASSKYPDRE